MADIENSYLRMDVHNEFAQRMKEENERQNHRISLLEDNYKEVKSLALSIERLTISLQNMVNEQREQNTRLNELEAKPARNWDKLMWVIGSIIVTAVITYVLTRVGIK